MKLVSWQKHIKSISGNSVIEVLVATAIVGIVLTALAVSMTSSIQNSAEAEYREIATRQAQDIMEVLRKDKNTLAWDLFKTTPGDGTWCVPATFTSISSASFSPANLSAMGGCPSVTSNNLNYYRAIKKETKSSVPALGDTQVRVTVYVYWNVGITGKERSTTVQQSFFKSY